MGHHRFQKPDESPTRNIQPPPPRPLDYPGQPYPAYQYPPQGYPPVPPSAPPPRVYTEQDTWMSRNKTAVALFSIVAVLGIIGLIFAVTGNAKYQEDKSLPLDTTSQFTSQEQAYLDDLHTIGYYNEKGDTGSVSGAYGICGSLALGESAAGLSMEIYVDTNVSLPMARKIVNAAIINICPEYR
jgi:hypothetical protein